MGKEIVYCSVCGDRILEGDFAKGRAVTRVDKNYCPKCANDSVKKSPKGISASRETTPTTGRRKRQTQRIPLVDKPGGPSRKPSIPLPLIIAIGIGVLVVILVVVVLSRG